MSYTVENVNGCTKKMIFTFENLDLSNEIQKAVKEKQKNVSLKGFRKGKAPLAMVQQIYGPQIENDALNRFVQRELFDAIEKEELRVVGYPSFEAMDYKAGESIKFNAIVEIFPEVEVGDFSKFEFKKTSAEVSENDVEAVKKNYLSNRAEMKEIEGNTSLALGHFAVLNFQGEKEDGERPESMKGEEFVLEIGSNQFIPGFEDGMIGMKKGETKTLELTFPGSYHVEELKNAKVRFDVDLLEIKEKVFPEFTDEMAKEFEFESVDDFFQKTRANLLSQKEREATEKLNQQIIEKLIETNKFDVPSTLVEKQKEAIRADISHTLQSQGYNDSMIDEYFNRWAGDLEAKALFQVKSGLILDNIAKKYNVEATEEDFQNKITETATSSGLSEEVIRNFYTKDKRMKQNLMYGIREEKTFAKISEIAKVK